MKRYGNIRFNRRIFAFVGMFFIALSVLMPLSSVFADTLSSGSSLTFNFSTYYDSQWHDRDNVFTASTSDSSPIYSYVFQLPGYSSNGPVPWC